MTSSPLLLRSAVNRVVVAAARQKHSFRKSALSTLSYHPSQFHDGDDDVSSRLRTAPLAKYAVPTTTMYDYITSNLSNMMTTTLYGNSALSMVVDVTVKQSEQDEEEDSCWEDIVTQKTDESSSPLEDLSIWQISTLKRRKKMMNKHKLRKRKKKMRLKTRRQ
mmetsp:Transcript_13190/g.23589  ORF Transcript_13190/g.23589 Transcript_13190/m.23589 type:complete len:163 (-) Transcript_13190:129-617(-)